MDEAIIETFDNVKFIKGQTRLNQANWQEYFGTFLPNGVYEGLLVRNYTDSVTSTEFRYLTDGTVFVNGIFAKLETENGYTDIGGYFDTDPLDRLICVRVYFDEERAEIIQKTDIGLESTATTDHGKIEDTLNKLLYDESYGCERNSFYWDIPIFYQGKRVGNGTTSPYETLYQPGRSLRRVIDLENKVKTNPTDITGHFPDANPHVAYLISGNNIYNSFQKTNDMVYIYMDTLPASTPSGALVRCALSAGQTLRMKRNGWLNDFLLHPSRIAPIGTHNQYRYVLSDPTGWSWGPGSSEANAEYDSYTASADTTLYLRFTQIEDYPLRYFVEVLKVAS